MHKTCPVHLNKNRNCATNSEIGSAKQDKTLKISGGFVIWRYHSSFHYESRESLTTVAGFFISYFLAICLAV